MASASDGLQAVTAELEREGIWESLKACKYKFKNYDSLDSSLCYVHKNRNKSKSPQCLLYF